MLPLVIAVTLARFSAPSPEDNAGAEIVHATARATSAERWRARWRAGGQFAEWVRPWEEQLGGEAPLRIETRDCGVAKARYDPNRDTVTICYELVAAFERFHRTPARVEAAVHWAVLHEVGHALVARGRWRPPAATEERAADDFATLAVLAESPRSVRPLTVTMEWFSALAKRQRGTPSGPHGRAALRRMRIQRHLRQARAREGCDPHRPRPEDPRAALSR
ncbi:MAG: DUF4344 domain-containing metallopeptidase [Myxococcota bacterium]